MDALRDAIDTRLRAAARGVNALVKVSEDGLLTRGCMNATALVVALPLTAFVPAPSMELWPILIAATLCTACIRFSVAAYRHGDLSQTLPLARGIAPLGVAALAAAFAGEQSGGAQMAGVVLISCGSRCLRSRAGYRLATRTARGRIGRG